MSMLASRALSLSPQAGRGWHRVERSETARRVRGTRSSDVTSPSPASLRCARSAPSPASRGEGRARSRASAVALILFVDMSRSLYAAGNVAAGRQKALQCQTCHGLDGLSKMPEAPNIAGSPEQYLVRQLNAFRKGERKNEMMTVVVQQLIGSGCRRSRGLLRGDRGDGESAEMNEPGAGRARRIESLWNDVAYSGFTCDLAVFDGAGAGLQRNDPCGEFAVIRFDGFLAVEAPPVAGPRR